MSNLIIRPMPFKRNYTWDMKTVIEQLGNNKKIKHDPKTCILCRKEREQHGR